MRFAFRREDRRNLIVGFVGLMAIMTAHSVMETARDTLFLTSLPATDLPRAYLAIALLAILELKVHERVLPHVRDRRTLLAASLFFGSLITLGFWALLDDLGAWAPFGFYVWTGLLITVVLIEFWLLLDDAVTVTQAKRIFPAIAAGGVTGAMLGSALSAGLLRFTPPAGLVLMAATILGMAASSAFLWKVGETRHASDSERGPSLGWLLRDSYLSRVLGLVALGTIALTIVDFIFKSSVAQNIPPQALGPFFARFYLGLNSVALVVQVVGAGWLLRGFGAHRSSALLPILIFGGAAGLAIGPILPFAVALKAVDGSLRHTLYRSSVEVLYLPLESNQRERAKGIIEVFGHRVGQAMGSVLIIGAVALGLTTEHLGIVLLLLVAAWLAAILSTRHQYVDQFRTRLRQGVIDTDLELGELDRDSIDALLDALNGDRDDEEVLATIADEDLLEEQLRWSLQRVVQLMQWRAAVDADEESSSGRELLRGTLYDKEQATLERAFWLMGLRHPDEDFTLVWRGLRSDNARLRAASVEVLEAVLVGPSREAVLAIVDDGESPERRARTAAAALGISRDDSAKRKLTIA